MDPLVDASDAAAVETLDDDAVEALVQLLDAVRAANAERGAARHAAPAPGRGVPGACGATNNSYHSNSCSFVRLPHPLAPVPHAHPT
jgi:hypothetical protein